MREVLKKEKNWLLLFGIILLIAVVRLFYGIQGDYFSFLDEYTTFDTAAGFFHTGKFYHWDFHNKALSDYAYDRAWPHTILLAMWFKIFGLNVVAGRTLSAVFGVLFVISLFYISKKIYHNYWITLLSCIFVMTNTTVLTLFRQIRMYSLWLLVTIWLLYYIYQMLTVKPVYSSKSKIFVFIEKNFNFSIKYIVLTLLFFVLGYCVHINTLAIGVGMILFYFYLLVMKRERRYAVALGCVFLLAAVLLIVLPGLFGADSQVNIIYQKLFGVINEGFREEVNIRYWYWLQDFVHNKSFFCFAVVCMVIGFIKNILKRGSEFEFSVYAFLVTGSTMWLFLYCLSRYYAARYMLYAVPLIAMLMAWGIVETFTIGKRKSVLWASVIVSVLICAFSIKQEFVEVYDNPNICYHRNVYEKLKEDAKKEIQGDVIPVAGYDFRDYYAVQIIDDYESAKFDRENDMEILKEFAKKYPDGYVLVETAKINGFPEVIKYFIQNHSERIAGDGIDDYNIEMVRYHFVEPAEQTAAIEKERQNGFLSYSFEIKGDDTNVYIELDASKIEQNTDTIFINFGIFTFDKDTEDKFYQLRLPENFSENKYYYEITIPKACQEVWLKDECMLYYSDGSCREKLLYEN